MNDKSWTFSQVSFAVWSEIDVYSPNEMSRINEWMKDLFQTCELKKINMALTKQTKTKKWTKT